MPLLYPLSAEGDLDRLSRYANTMRKKAAADRMAATLGVLSGTDAQLCMSRNYLRGLLELMEAAGSNNLFDLVHQKFGESFRPSSPIFTENSLADGYSRIVASTMHRFYEVLDSRPFCVDSIPTHMEQAARALATGMQFPFLMCMRDCRRQILDLMQYHPAQPNLSAHSKKWKSIAGTMQAAGSPDQFAAAVKEYQETKEYAALQMPEHLERARILAHSELEAMDLRSYARMLTAPEEQNALGVFDRDVLATVKQYYGIFQDGSTERPSLEEMHNEIFPWASLRLEYLGITRALEEPAIWNATQYT